jgi:hypothetical protein
MKNLAVTVLLALLVVLTAASLRRAVAGTVVTADNPALVAIGTDPVPPLDPPPPPKPSNLKANNATRLLAIGTDPVPPLDPPKPKPSNLKASDATWLLAIGTDPVPPLDPPAPKPKPKN